MRQKQNFAILRNRCITEMSSVMLVAAAIAVSGLLWVAIWVVI
ncbi:hypothetical protein [Epibacterium ulvae]|uniref:Uncharacterized protein n=1 Tax=Epibacterium ulvae TaxID=1156985 RepID=A0A1G5QR59_9RHOB|nr:hypothetical protein [Epibacterium ulvae]SCZ64232.1 hypothetical protein SAMN04488118_105208 [Epibacterium ulvae]